MSITCLTCRTEFKLKAAMFLDKTSAKCPKCGGVVLFGSSPESENDKTADFESGTPSSDEISLDVDNHSSRIAFSFLAPSQAPDEIGRLSIYRVLDVIGSGGMGAVFRAEDPDLKRHIALKVMLPQFASKPAAKARFLREARAQAAVEHDHIITIFQVGEDRGVPFIAMPLLKGQTLADALKANPVVPVDVAVRIARETAEGLTAAHEGGLVHRDIKPGNIWLEGTRHRVKILDFGLVCGDAAPVTNSDPVSHQGMLVGTPAYMSPEQAHGEALDARTDLFSLGTVLYQMLTGKAPFAAGNTAGILLAVVSHDPPLPSELTPSVPPELNQIVMQLLAKPVAERFPSAAAVVQALWQVEANMNRTAEIPAENDLPTSAGPWAAMAVRDPDSFPMKRTYAVASPASGPAPSPVQSQPWPWVMVASLFAVVGIGLLAAQIIIIRNKDGSETKIEVPEGATVTVKGKDGKMLAAVPGKPDGGTPEKAVAHPDRKAAEYVLSVGGAVRIDGQEVEIKNAADLPKQRFTLTGINLQRKQVTNEGLATMKDCKNLTHLWLHDTNVTDEDLAYFKNCKGLINLDLLVTKVTDAGLANFKDFKEIKFLDLAYTGVTDEGLTYLKDCKGLRTLSIGSTKVTDAGLGHLKDCNELMNLFLTNTAVTDAGLAHLKNCKGLQGIDLKGTKVTEKGLADFHAALPGCKLQYNGGVIQPKQ